MCRQVCRQANGISGKPVWPVVTHVGQVRALKGSADSLEMGSKIKNEVKSGLIQLLQCLMHKTFKKEGHSVFW